MEVLRRNMRAVMYITHLLYQSSIHSFAEQSAADEEIVTFVNQSAAELSPLGNLTTKLLVNGNSIISIWIPLPCEHGPRKIVHTDGNIFFKPEIVKTSCDGLRCSPPTPGTCRALETKPRIAFRQAYRYRLTLVPLGLITESLGPLITRYDDHIGCQCQCP